MTRKNHEAQIELYANFCACFLLPQFAFLQMDLRGSLVVVPLGLYLPKCVRACVCLRRGGGLGAGEADSGDGSQNRDRCKGVTSSLCD